MAQAGNMLWVFSKHEPRGTGNKYSGSAPKLLHASAQSSSILDRMTKRKTDIDVLRTFPWTNSPIHAINQAPYIDLVEHDIKANPMLNQMANNLSVAGDLIPDMVKDEIKTQTSKAMDQSYDTDHPGAGLLASLGAAGEAIAGTQAGEEQ